MMRCVWCPGSLTVTWRPVGDSLSQENGIWALGSRQMCIVVQENGWTVLNALNRQNVAI